jgi:hypothetical protein
MKLDEWVDQEIKRATGRAPSRKIVLESLSRETGINLQTLAACERGARLTNYGKALAVQRATGGTITVVDLCDPDPRATLVYCLCECHRLGIEADL